MRSPFSVSKVVTPLLPVTSDATSPDLGDTNFCPYSKPCLTLAVLRGISGEMVGLEMRSTD